MKVSDLNSTPFPSAAAIQPSPQASTFLVATGTLWRREMIRFFRQRNRVASALLTPILFWLMLGFGLDQSFSAPTQSDSVARTGYLEYFFPGTVLMILLFSAIFSTISLIEDRREGFLQGVLVAPIPRMGVVMGKVCGGASVALIQGLGFLLFWSLVGEWPGLGWVVLTLFLLTILSIGFASLGFCIAWPMDSAAGFHAVMMLILMPMWFLSGAVFPLIGAPKWMQVLMWANPLMYGHAALTSALSGGQGETTALSFWPAALITVAIVSGALVLASHLVLRPVR